jgi:lysophospholipase L1-like esterase
MLTKHVARGLAMLVACVAALAGTGAPLSAQAAGLPDQSDRGYLALGDSVAFGFNPLVDPHDTSNFVGYPAALARRLDFDLTNVACPGEASGGFISLMGADHQCRAYRAGPFPLQVAYSTSQLDFAVAFLRDHPGTRLVTLDLGVNDLFVLQNQCASASDPTLCVAAGFPLMLQTLASNLQTIYGRIRGEAHYRHQIVGLTYYAVDFNDPVGMLLIQSINATVAETTLEADGQLADGFEAFRRSTQVSGGDTCAAGLLIVTRSSPLTCDIHPSARGREVLADAIQAMVYDRDGQ